MLNVIVKIYMLGGDVKIMLGSAVKIMIGGIIEKMEKLFF